MPRNIDSTLLAALSSPYVEIVHLLQITFRSQICYAWTGLGALSWNGNSFLGVGSLGSLGDFKEASEVRADGTSVTLSGIDPVWLGESLTDIWLGAPAYRWLAAVEPGTATLIGTPYLLFSGQVDKPTVTASADTITIDLALETRMINHQRALNRRYTANDQHSNGYPDDTGFNWMEVLQDVADDWGSSAS